MIPDDPLTSAEEAEMASHAVMAAVDDLAWHIDRLDPEFGNLVHAVMKLNNIIDYLRQHARRAA